ncbi:MAG: hypothetical protein J6Z34_05185 [Clostridia bacterium]|nr:hypothetical protein [Clostridia bacterium]
MRFLTRTLKCAVCVVMVAMFSVMLFGCDAGGENNSGNGTSSGTYPHTSSGGTSSGTSNDTSSGSSEDTGNKPEVFNPSDFLTYTCPIEEGDTDWYETEGYDIIIQAGQSNAEGNGYGSVGNTNAYVPRDDILYYVDDTHNRVYNLSTQRFRVMRAEERSTAVGKCNDFSLAFAYEYLNSGLLPLNRKILIVRTAIGGTGFSENHVNFPNWNWKPDGDLYVRMINAVEAALDLPYGDSADYEHRLVAFLWHQGENDAIARMSENTYYGHLKTLLNGVRTRFNCPKLPFVCGDFVHDWKNETIGTANACAKIIAATKRVCSESAPAAFVPTEGLKSNKQDPTHPNSPDIEIDNIHFCREAVNLLGKKYFDAYMALIQAGYVD